LRLRADGHDFYTSYTLSRITGFMGHWMTFSGQEMLVLMLLLAWLLSKPEAPRWAVTAGWCAAGAIVVALLLAFTRSVWVACFAGACYLLWKSHRRWLIALPVAVVIAYLAAPEWLQMRARSIADRNDNSVQARLLMWKAGLAMVKDRPVFGVGPDGVKYEFDRYRPDTYVPPAWYGHLHNNYVQMAAERGLPGLLLFLWLIFAALSDQWRIARQAGARAYLARGAVAATIALLVAGFFEYNFGDSEVAMLWLFLLVHGYTEGRQTTPAHEEHPEPEALAVV
jgi:O-antigen ligase